VDTIIFKPVTELAQLIRTKFISSEELVNAYLKRIEAVNPPINAVVQLCADAALDQAREADATLARGESKGALHGVPMTIKDSLDTAGVISTGGTLGRAHFIPEKDATVVARLRAAGAILLGKTNTPELTLSFETNNLVYGRTNNPFDTTRSSGGSSGGAAAIITTGGTPFDIGSDYGGSIRLPSHFCGIAGIKPTSGRVPRTGHIIPFAAGASDAYQQIGPMARYVQDLAMLLPIIAGPDWIDPAIVSMPLHDPQKVDLKQLRVVFHTDNGAATPTPEVIQTVNKVVQALESQVALVEEKRPEGIERTWEVWDSLDAADGGAAFTEIIRQAGTTKTTLKFPRRGGSKAADSAEFNRRIIEVDRFRSRMLAFIKDYDVLICPVNAGVAIPHGTLTPRIQDFSYTATYNITGWPGVVVRAGASPEGLPIGVQILARPWREDVALAVAQFVESTFGGWQLPPAFPA
jgi:amidase